MKVLITKAREKKVLERLEQLLVQGWKASRPLYPKMFLDFKVSCTEDYFSAPGQVWFNSPVWRGNRFALGILLHEGHHWNIYPIDAFRALAELMKARQMLAEELGFQPKKSKDLYNEEEDWTGFGYSLDEIQAAQNVLGDYLINLHIYDNYQDLWDPLWSFLTKDGAFYQKGKSPKRDSSFTLYLAGYSFLIPNKKTTYVNLDATKDKASKIGKIVKACRENRIGTTYAFKELAKLFHEHYMADKKFEEEGKGYLKCPKCKGERWEILGIAKKD